MTYTDADFEIAESADGKIQLVAWRKDHRISIALNRISRKDFIALKSIGYVGDHVEPALWYGEYEVASDRELISIYDSKGNELHRMEVTGRVLHRSTNQAIHSSPITATHLANQGATSLGPIQASIGSGYITYGTTAAYGSGTIIPYASSSAVQAAMLAHQQAIINAKMAYGHGMGTATLKHTPDKEIYKKLPNEGMRAGEIVAYRCWPIKNGFLWSTAANRAWAPNEPMSAKDGHLEEGMGVFSFKEMSYAIHEFSSHGGYYSTEGMVFGSIWIWGNIVEHDTGYRAQYAAVRTLDFTRSAARTALDEIRNLYHVVGDPDERRPILSTDE